MYSGALHYYFWKIRALDYNESRSRLLMFRLLHSNVIEAGTETATQEMPVLIHCTTALYCHSL